MQTITLGRILFLLCSLFLSHNLFAQTNLALNKTATASSALTPALNAVDGNGGTRWESAHGVSPSWLSVDLGANYALSSVVIDWEAANAASYDVQGSVNGTTWTTVATRTGGAFGTRTDTVAATGTYRYVRINCTQRSVGNNWGYSFWELKVYGSVPQTSSASSAPANLNLATTATVTASSQLQPAALAVDNNAGTRWESAHAIDPTWISLDFGSAKTLSSVVIDWEAANAASYLVQGSNNNSTWTDLASRTGGIFGVRTDTLAVSGSYRYLRVYGTARSTGNQWGYSIFELKVYGAGGTGSSTPGSIAASSSSRSSTPVASSIPSSSNAPVSSSSSVALGDITPLYSANTVREPELVIEYPDRIETIWSDRGRDRHAREPKLKNPTPGLSEEAMLKELEEGAGYDHYLAHYWIQRTATIIIKDYVAKGGDRIDFDMYTLTPLGPKDLRVWFRGVNTVAEFYDNGYVGLVPGEINHYRRSFGGGAATSNPKVGRPIRVGDRMEIEVSQFLDNPLPAGSRTNYYGTTILYMVGGGKGDQPNGIVPWEGRPTLDVDNNGAVLRCAPNNVEAPCPTINDSFPLPQKAWTGGRITLPYQYSNEPMDHFKQLAGHTGGGSSIAGGGNAQVFTLGRRLVHTNFTTGQHTEKTSENAIFTEQIGKVGPRFYSTSCVGCHFNNGRSIPRGLGVTINNQAIKIGANAAGAPHALYGNSLQPFSTAGGSGVGEAQAQLAGFVAAPNYADGTPNTLTRPRYNFVNGAAPEFFSVRNSPAFVGMGLLDAVPEADIIAIANANNGAGISGRVQTVIDPVTGQTRLGRFGWKATSASLKHQVASALNIEMGITSSIFPRLDCGTNQTDCQNGNELNNADLDRMVTYMATLGVPARRNLEDAQALRGELVFAEIGCNACHKETLKTSQFSPLAEVRSQTIHPYTDLLLHDMGPGLADNLGEGVAVGSEWRTAPLWGIGLTADVSGYREAYLHDGRARTLHEAILWHDGEAANARKAYAARTQGDKDALIRFLKSL
ncbi:MAG: hypothetical protein K0Q67_1984 [Cellvibrio sp.]|nr:hypothetical protein [Cellvibrio sp.]